MRIRGQVPRRRASADSHAPPDTPCFSHLTYDFTQFTLFGEGTWKFNDQWSVTGCARHHDFEEDRLLTHAGVFADAGSCSPRIILNADARAVGGICKGNRLPTAPGFRAARRAAASYFAAAASDAAADASACCSAAS